MPSGFSLQFFRKPLWWHFIRHAYNFLRLGNFELQARVACSTLKVFAGRLNHRTSFEPAHESLFLWIYCPLKLFGRLLFQRQGQRNGYVWQTCVFFLWHVEAAETAHSFAQFPDQTQSAEPPLWHFYHCDTFTTVTLLPHVCELNQMLKKGPVIVVLKLRVLMFWYVIWRPEKHAPEYRRWESENERLHKGLLFVT